MTVKETRHFTWIEDPQFQTWQTTVERDGFTVKVVMQVDELNDPGTNDLFAPLAMDAPQPPPCQAIGRPW